VRSKSYETKMHWVTSLKEGDIICDCRYKHLAIKEISEDRWRTIPDWMVRLCLALPAWIGDRLEIMLLKLFGKDKLHDKLLILEDGQSCSAFNCCDPADHPRAHPQPTSI